MSSSTYCEDLAQYHKVLAQKCSNTVTLIMVVVMVKTDAIKLFSLQNVSFLLHMGIYDIYQRGDSYSLRAYWLVDSMQCHIKMAMKEYKYISIMNCDVKKCIDNF
jgi:hypothetical protein